MNIAAKKLIPLIDLTSLNATDDDDSIKTFVRSAVTPFGRVAAVCIYPQFVALARQELDAHDGKNIAVATVVNFPEGTQCREDVLNVTAKALDDGASEIDLVLPWRALLDEDLETAAKMVNAVSAVCTPHHAKLKVIIESGALESEEHIREASIIAIDNGANFIKTSTGKIKAGATPEAVATILDTILAYGVKESVGLKIAGGVRTLEDLQPYLDLIAHKAGEAWMQPAHLRIGASVLLKTIINELGLHHTSNDET